MIPTYQECGRYYFDKTAADKPVRFIQGNLIIWQGHRAGKPFELQPWQKQIVRTLFGWKRRSDGRRRFREVYLLTAKGSGKTPLMAAIGLYMLLADGEHGPQIISAATDASQAYLTLDAAKRFVNGNPAFASVAESMQYAVRGLKNNGNWTHVSGDADGKHGLIPNCVLCDEAHEWPNGKLYETMTANAAKRKEPIVFVASNAGPSRGCYAWQLHERAVATRDGRKGADEALLPCIFEAPESLPWDGEAAARASNPSLGSFITFDQLKPEVAKAKASPAAENRYRRLFLSQWQKTGSGAWLEIKDWEAVESFDEPPADAALYVGMDLSQSDDLCALVYVYVSPAKYFVDAHFWIPGPTAEKYQEREAVTYGKWADEGDVSLIDAKTVNDAAIANIVGHIQARHGRTPVKAVCYDPYRATLAAAMLDAAGIPCMPVRQGWSVNDGCRELEKRLKELTIAVRPNALMRFCVENAEVSEDARGNIWPVKPGAKGKFAGRRGAKIDGVAALVTALTVARKHDFPAAAAKSYQGTVCVI